MYRVQLHELVFNIQLVISDTRDLKSLGASRTGSIPVPGTNKNKGLQ
jgi:hypothetical protein